MKRTLVTFLALAAAACAGTRGARESTAETRISEEDVGRLGPEQTGAVERARQFRGSARDEQARASLRLQQAQHEVEAAKADQQAADLDAKRAENQEKTASESREPTELEGARQMKTQAQLHKDVANAHVDYASKLVEARKASLDAAQKQVALGDARLEWAKLQALQQARVPAATKYDANKYQSQVNEAQKSFDDSMQKARDLDSQASASQRRWEDLRRQMQARGGATQTG
jgi:hypothetical protein